MAGTSMGSRRLRRRPAGRPGSRHPARSGRIDISKVDDPILRRSVGSVKRILHIFFAAGVPIRSIGKRRQSVRCKVRGSDAPRVGVPEDLVLLELEADRQAGLQDPGGQVGRADLAERRRRTGRGSGRARRCARTCPTAQSKSSRSQTTTFTSSVGLRRSRLLQRFASTSPEPGVFRSRITRTRAVDRADVERPAGLQQDGPPGVGQPRHQRAGLGLEQRLAPR